MNQQLAIILVIAAGLLVIILLIVKNRKDRKKLFTPHSTDPVEETHTDQVDRRDKL